MRINLNNVVQKRIGMKTILHLVLLASMAQPTLADSSTNFWSPSDAGLRCAIVVDKANIKTGELVTVMFIVNNNGNQSVSVPVPDNGTLAFYNGNGTALAAEPGRRDDWTTLHPGNSLIYTLSYEWTTPGTYQSYFEYYSRFDDKPFKKMTTPRQRITVTK